MNRIHLIAAGVVLFYAAAFYCICRAIFKTMCDLSFNVIGAKRVNSGKSLQVAYTERDNDLPILFTVISCEELEHYLKCLPEVDCPTLEIWARHTSPVMIWRRISQFMEHQLSRQHEALQIDID